MSSIRLTPVINGFISHLCPNFLIVVIYLSQARRQCKPSVLPVLSPRLKLDTPPADFSFKNCFQSAGKYFERFAESARNKP
jgi:hypothetical protein